MDNFVFNSEAPGTKLAEMLSRMGVSRVELASRMGTSVKAISDVIQGKTRLREAFALRLESALGTSARVWLVLELDYRLAIAKERVRPVC